MAFDAQAGADYAGGPAKLTALLASESAPDCFLVQQNMLPGLASAGGTPPGSGSRFSPARTRRSSAAQGKRFSQRRARAPPAKRSTAPAAPNRAVTSRTSLS